MKTVPEIKSYKSPQRKLVSFFEKSRDRWKSKCQGAKSSVRRLKDRVGFLEKSRAHWKGQVQELAKELARMKAQEPVRPRTEKGLKKNLRRSWGSTPTD